MLLDSVQQLRGKEGQGGGLKRSIQEVSAALKRAVLMSLETAMIQPKSVNSGILESSSVAYELIVNNSDVALMPDGAFSVSYVACIASKLKDLLHPSDTKLLSS